MRRKNMWLIVSVFVFLNLFYFNAKSEEDSYITNLRSEIKKLDLAKKNTQRTNLLFDVKERQLEEYNNKISLINSKITSYKAFSKMDTIKRNQFITNNNNTSLWEFTVNGKKQKSTDNDFTNALKNLNKNINDTEKIKFSKEFKELPLDAQEKILSMYKKGQSDNSDPMYFYFKQDDKFRLALNTIKSNKSKSAQNLNPNPTAAPVKSTPAAAVSSSDRANTSRRRGDARRRTTAVAPAAAPAASAPAAAVPPPAPAPAPAPTAEKENEKTNAEKCLAVDTRERDDGKKLETETDEQKKLSEDKCVTGSFFVGDCRDSKLEGNYCLKRCGGWTFINKGYTDDLSHSEIVDLLFKEDGSIDSQNKTALVAAIEDQKIENNSTPAEIKQYLDSQSSKGYSSWHITKTGDNKNTYHGKLEQLAIALNKAAVKCNEIKKISYNLIHSKNKSYEEEIKSSNQLDYFVKNNLSSESCSSELESNDNINALKIETDCGERTLIPHEWNAGKDNSSVGKLLYKDAQNKDQSVDLIFDSEKKSFYVQDDQVCHAGEFNSSSYQHYAKLTKVHASQMSENYCSFFNNAKTANPTAPVPAAAPAKTTSAD